MLGAAAAGLAVIALLGACAVAPGSDG